ncbi:MAG: deoxynucleoside kinase [Anaerolineales bacterium]|nr:deoxynucleoside kinase [Anaerolineales bacterium]
MGKLITVVGNTGVGKTTFTRLLCKEGLFICGMEQHAERPFQALFAQNLQSYALANQIDYLLLRAEQELEIRAQPSTGIQDGGLEMDYYIFTHHFYQKGYLNREEFQVCQRLYHLLRNLLAPPDLIIWLTAPLDVVTRRYQQRGRMLEIAALADLEALEMLLHSWLQQVNQIPILKIDTSIQDITCIKQLQIVTTKIQALL